MTAPAHFTVSQVRVAASCPRILYFDAEQTRRQGSRPPVVTRIWKSGGETTACGSLFHAAVEKFNARAADDPAVRELLRTVDGPDALCQRLMEYVYWNCVNRDALFAKSGSQQQAFLAALRVYLGELADILSFARKLGRPDDEILAEMFGDRRRRVDATFPVGPGGEAVRVAGILDYVFYDWRVAGHRILDYKLTPAHEPGNDLFQVCVYALMHHMQHGTEPDAGVLYLHPARQMVEKKWADVWAERDKVHGLLASMCEWVRYDERGGAGLKPPGEPLYCDVCKWDGECVRRLGPKSEGGRRDHPGEPVDLSRRDKPGGSPRSALETASKKDLSEEKSNLPADELRLGRATGGGPAVGLPRDALPTHVAVVGAAGSGKTWLAKVIAEEAILQGTPVLAVDPQGDLVQFLRPRDPAGLDDAERGRRERFWQTVEPRVFTPGSSHAVRLSLSPIRLARASELTGEADPLRRAEEWEGMLAGVAANLVGLARAGGETDSQQTFILQVLKRLADDGGELRLADVAAAAARPDEYGIEGADAFVRKAEREKLARKLNNLLHGPSANLFTGGRPLDLDEFCRPASPGKVPLNVVYLNALADDGQKQGFVAALAAEVYRWMMTSAAAPGRPRLLLYLDEARDYVPAGAAKPPAKMPLIRLCAQARKYGVACLVCTQSPRSVDYNVFGNCSTKLVGRLESAQDADRVADWFSQGGPTPPWVKARAGAERGKFVGRWPGMPAELEGQAFQSRVLYSLHEGAWTPERLERETRGDAP